MIKMAIRLLLYGLIALLMPLLVHAEDIETKEETKIEEKEDISIVKNVNPGDPTESCTRRILSYDINNNNMKIATENYYIDNTGSLVQNNNWIISDFIAVTKDRTYVIEKGTGTTVNGGVVYYDLNYNYIKSENYTHGTQITFDNNYYIKLNIYKSRWLTFTGDDCRNMEEETMIKTQNIEKLLIIGVGLLFAIFIIGGRK